MSRFPLLHRLGRSAAALLAALLLVVPSSAAAQQSARLSGDVNNDGSVSATDAQMVLASVIELPLPDGADRTFGDADCDGAVTALDAQIILAYVVDLDVARFCVGKEYSAPVASIVLEDGTGKVLVGSTLRVAATALDSNNVAIPGKAFTWTSSDTAVATVDADGVVTGRDVGTVTITATVDGKSGSTAIEVLSASAVRRLVLSPRTTTVVLDDSTQLTAVVQDGAGNPVADATITWRSADSTIAAVSATGVVTGRKINVVKVYATSDTLTDSATVTVTAARAVATRSWVGTTSSDWHTASNWSPVGVPVSGDTVQIASGAANQPVLQQNAVAGGLVVLGGASLDIGTHELAVSTRIDAEGDITGAGLLILQGVQGRASYVRGTLPRLRITGTAVLVNDTRVAGSLELFPSSVIEVNGATLSVSGDADIQGELQMRTADDTVDVRGNARFFNDVADPSLYAPVMNDGVLRVGGNLTIVVPAPSVRLTPFPATGAHRTILDGGAQQTVTDSGLVVVQFQELDIANRSGGVVFEAADTAYFRIAGDLSAKTATSISGNGRVNVHGNVTTLTGGSVSLRNLAVRGVLLAGSNFRPDTLTLLGPSQQIPFGAAYQYQNVVAAGRSRFTGPTDVAGSVLVGCLTWLSECFTPDSSSLDVASQVVTIGRDLHQALVVQPQLVMPRLFMQSAADTLTIGGGVLGPVGDAVTTEEFVVDADTWTAGLLRVAGDFLGSGAGASGTHHTILNGTQLQQLRGRGRFHFQELTMAGEVGVELNDSDTDVIVGVRGNYNLTTSAYLSGSGRLDVLGDFTTATGSRVELSAMSVGLQLFPNGEFSPDTAQFTNTGTLQTIRPAAYQNVQVSGKAVFGGSMTFSGSLLVDGGAELVVGRRHVTVARDATVGGLLRMSDPSDTLTIEGSIVFPAGNGEPVATSATAGVLRVGGSYSAGLDGFSPSGSHKVIWMPRLGDRLAGRFQNLEIIGKGTTASGTAAVVDTAIVGGTLVASEGTGPIRISGAVEVTGNATLTQADTVYVTPSVATQFKGNLRARHLSLSGPGATVAGNLAMVDGASLSGRIIYRGTYTEEGTPGDMTRAEPALAGVKTIRWVQQPTDGTAGAPFSPAVAVELLDSSDVRLPGTAVVTLTSDGLLGTRRLVTVNGLATFTDVGSGIAGTRSLMARVFTAGTPRVDVASGTFTATAGAAARIGFSTADGQPQDVQRPAKAGEPILATGGAPLRAQVTDANGVPVAHAGSVTLAYTRAGLPDTTIVHGIATLDAAGGATFGTLVFDSLDVYTLIPQVDGLTSVATDTFSVVRGTPARVIFQSADGEVGIRDGVAGTVLRAADSTALRVQVVDAAGHPVGYTGTVGLQVVSGDATALVDAEPVTLDADGSAILGTARIRRTGTFRLTASAGSVVGDTVDVTIVSAPAERVAFRGDAGGTGVGQPLEAGAPLRATDNRLLRVQAIDSLGNFAPFAGTATVSTGGSSPDSVYGKKSFALDSLGGSVLDSLYLKTPGTYALVGAVTGLESVPTDTFRVVLGQARKIVLMNAAGTPQTVRAGVAGQPLTASNGSKLRAQVTDLAGNPVTNPQWGTVLLTAKVNDTSATVTGGSATFSGTSSAEFNAPYLTKAGDAVLTPTLNSLTGVASAPFTVDPGAANSMRMKTQPGEAVTGLPFGIQPIVELRDAYSNLATKDTTAVRVTIASSGAPPNGTTTVRARDGYATFTDLSIATAGSYQLRFDALGTVFSSTFSVAQAPATQLTFQTEPAGAVAYKAFTTQPRIELRDANGNIVPTSTATVTVTLQPLDGGSGVFFGGAQAVAASNGIAIFTNLGITAPGDYRLVFSSAGTTDLADTIIVTPATPVGLRMQTHAFWNGSIGISGSTVPQQPAILIVDANGNRVYGATNEVTILQDMGQSSARAEGTLTVAAVDGVATFTGIRAVLNDPALSSATFRPNYTSDGLNQIVNNSVTVATVVPVVTTQPVGGASGALLATAPVVELRNASGTTHVTADNEITVTLKAATGSSGTLGGTTVLVPENGVLTFADLVVTNTGTAEGTFQLEIKGPGTRTTWSSWFTVAAP